MPLLARGISSFYFGFEIVDTMEKEIVLQSPYYQSVGKMFIPQLKLSYHLAPGRSHEGLLRRGWKIRCLPRPVLQV